MVSCILYSKFLHLVSCMLYSQYPHLTSDQVWLINEKILHRVNECERASWGDFFGHKCSNHNWTLGWFDLRQKGSNLSTCRRLRPCPTSRRGFDPMTHRVRTNAAHICIMQYLVFPDSPPYTRMQYATAMPPTNVVVKRQDALDFWISRHFNSSLVQQGLNSLTIQKLPNRTIPPRILWINLRH